MRFRSCRAAAIAAVLFSFPVATSARAQGSDNKGTEFVLAFSSNYLAQGNLRLFVAGDTATTGTVAIPGLTWSQNFSVTPGAITSITVPSSAMVTTTNGKANRGILLTAAAEVAVYGLNQRFATTDAFLGLPTDILGTEHIVMTYEALTPTIGAVLTVVGTADNTTLTITPSVTTQGRTAGVAYNVTLNRLEVYQLETDGSGEDLSGTIIQSTQPVAVFSGNECANVPRTRFACDHLVEQIPPTATWGQSFLTRSLATRRAGDVFRIIARDDATEIRIDGALVTTLDRAKFHEFILPSNSGHLIQATGPAMLMQFSQGSSADGVTSDPFMMMVPPTEQFLTSYTVSTPPTSPVAFRNFINVVVPTADVGSLLVDGAAPTATFQAIGTTGFSAAEIAVAAGSHTLSAPNGLGVYSYGFAFFDSYGYPGGLALDPIAEADGWMTGGGSVLSKGTRYRHGFVLQCNKKKVPNKLQIHWGKNRFNLWRIKTVRCYDDPNIGDDAPVAGFDTIEGSGVGFVNGTQLANISFKMTDAGEPGTNDEWSFTITWGTNTVTASGKLMHGNHKAHRRMDAVK